MEFFISTTSGRSLQKTNGKIIGYLFLHETSFVDEQNFIYKGFFSPDPMNDRNNPRAKREGLSTVYAEIFKWFNSIDCEQIIIDIRFNLGGRSEVCVAMSEFFGTDRVLMNFWTQDVYEFKKPLISILNKQIATVNSFSTHQNFNLGRAYVSLNDEKYPGSVIRGTSGNPKQVIILDDIFAVSGGDIFPNLFMGENADKNLGSFTYTKIIGCVDGRCKGSTTGLQDLPVNPAISTFSIIRFSRDFPLNNWFYSKKFVSQMVQSDGIKPDSAPTLTGTAGGNPLPISFEETVDVDLGFITPHPRPPIPGWTQPPPNPNIQSTWRDTYLEQAILLTLQLI